jgi:hypothetical protein
MHHVNSLSLEVGDHVLRLLTAPAISDFPLNHGVIFHRQQRDQSAISRLENHAEDVRLSTVSRVARALGKAVRIELVDATCLRSLAHQAVRGTSCLVEGDIFSGVNLAVYVAPANSCPDQIVERRHLLICHT